MLNAGRPPEIRVDRPFLLYFEMTLYIILLFIALCAGMALSVYAFGTGGKRKRIFQDIYFLWKIRTAWACCTPRRANIQPS